MAYKIVQRNTCDGACCRESPQYPNGAGDDCIYRTGNRLDLACSLINDSIAIPKKIGDCPTHPTEDPTDALNTYCILWPYTLLTDFPDEELSFLQWMCGTCCLYIVDETDPRPAFISTIEIKSKGGGPR